MTTRRAPAPPAVTSVLIADDESSMRLLVSTTIESDNYQVIEAADGDEAWALIKRYKPSLVLLDVQMPECDGFDVLELLGKDLPPAVVFVTAYDQYALRAFEAGALDYLLKPFDNARFDRALSAAGS